MIKIGQHLKKYKLIYSTVCSGIGFILYGEYKTSIKTQQFEKIMRQTNFQKYDQKEMLYNFDSREQNLSRIQDSQYDLLIIGGGASGAGVALDAAQRGLKCLVVESHDFASGASSKSTKLIHGGVRYLQQAFEFSFTGLKPRLENLQLVKTALRERSFFVQNAYYMNKHIPFVIPSTNLFEALYYYAGVVAYHAIYLISRDKDDQVQFPFPEIISAREMKSKFPYLDPSYKFGIIYYDGQMNDSRMNIDLLLTSSLQNYQEGFQKADILNYTEFKKFNKNSNGQIIGGEIYDKIDDKTYQVKAKCVVNCTGVFSGYFYIRFKQIL